jgi:hypothetical protein
MPFAAASRAIRKEGFSDQQVQSSPQKKCGKPEKKMLCQPKF